MFNLPPNYALTLRKGQWSDVKYPAIASMELKLIPRDYFEQVGSEDDRSCIPIGDTSLSFLFDANVGMVTLKGAYAMEKLRLVIDVGNGKSKMEFKGQSIRITNTLAADSNINPFITHCINTIPVCLSLATDLVVFSAEATLTIGNAVEASLVTCLPSTGYRVVNPAGRVDELAEIVPLIGRCLRSARFLLATGYFRRSALFQ